MRCVNIDWLEVSAEESNFKYPCDAEYFRSQGYFVHERDYGTRVWGQVFTIEDEQGHDWIEIRREPPSGTSEFKGLTQFSCRLRLVNSQCYVKDCVDRLRGFMIKHDYIFKRIFRIDVCYDFEKFDTGDKPAVFARRYVEHKYRKINQCKLAAHAMDNWNDFAWETLSWGSTTSMVSTKLYNKTKEIKTISKHKTYIPMVWMECGLIDNPVSLVKLDSQGNPYSPEIWRLEFSMKSKADRWLVIEDVSGKRVKKRAIPHNLSLFDAPDKLWQRFQDLAFHYFRFKVVKYKGENRGVSKYALGKVKADHDRQEVRKDLCPDKVLFHWDKDHEFTQLDMAMSGAKPNNDMEILRRRLQIYRTITSNLKVRECIDVILEEINKLDLVRYTPRQLFIESETLRRTIAIRMKHPEKDVVETLEEVRQLLINDEIW